MDRVGGGRQSRSGCMFSCRYLARRTTREVFVCQRQGDDGEQAMITDPKEMDVAVDLAGSEVMSWVMFARVRGRKDLQQQRLPSSY